MGAACFCFAADMQTITIGRDAPSYSAKIENLPTGAKDFDVAQPNPKSSVVVNAAEFGLNENVENAATIINKALRACKERGAAKLVIDRGVYKAFEETTISIEGFKDFIIDGSGATIVFRREKTPNFNVEGCERFKLRNLNIDWDWARDPLASFVEVVGVSAKTMDDSYVDFKFLEYEDFPNKSARMVCTSPYDEAADCVGAENGMHWWFDRNKGPKRNKKIEWIKPNVARVYAEFNERNAKKKAVPIMRYKVGMRLRMQHYYYHVNNMFIRNCVNTTLENVNVYSCAGHAFVLHGKKQKFVLFKNVNVKRPEGGKHRVITCTADHFHVVTSAGFIKFQNCEFGLGADDCANFHDVSRYAKRNSDNSLYMAIYGEVGDRIEFRNTDFSPAGLTAKIVKIVPDKTGDRGFAEVFFDAKIPDKPDFILFNREFDTHNIIAENCLFWGNRARGLILQTNDVTIDGCRFYHNEMNAIKINSGYRPGAWTEGYGAKNIVVKNCVFEAANSTPTAYDPDNVSCITIATYVNKTRYPILRDILFENNMFIDTYSCVASISCCENVIFRNNVFEEKTARQKPLESRCTFNISNAGNVKIVDNVFFKSPLAKPAVLIDRATTSGIVVEGNKVVEDNIFNRIYYSLVK